MYVRMKINDDHMKGFLNHWELAHIKSEDSMHKRSAFISLYLGKVFPFIDLYFERIDITSYGMYNNIT